MRLRRLSIFGGAFVLVCGSLWAQEGAQAPEEPQTPAAEANAEPVNRQELGGSLPEVIFYNYEGPYTRIDSREQIHAIGRALGAEIRSGSEGAGDLTRYFVIHSVSAQDGSKLDADIFGLGRAAGVDHIRNLRLIIQGYLETAYEYSAADAALLAEYVTVYNAVYRANWDFFASRYKAPVLENLDRAAAGLATRYSEWPGQTLMVIPLATATAGELSAIDTSAISSDEVVQQMREEDDMSVPQRQDMVDLKEREAEAAEEKAAEQRAEAAVEKAAIAEERAQVQEERAQIQEERAQIQEEREQIAEAKPVTAQEKAETAQEEAALDRQEAALDEQEAALDKKEEALVEREQAVEQLEESAARNEERAAQKREEAQAERDSITTDQQTIIEGGGPAADKDTGAVGIRIVSAGSAFGMPVQIDPASGRILKRGTGLNTLRPRSVVNIGSRLFGIAGEEGENKAVRLIEIDRGTLEMKKQSGDDVDGDSLVWVSESNIYTIVLRNGARYLARFDQELSRQALSASQVHAYASLSFQGGKIYTQNDTGEVIILDPLTLME